MDIRFFAAGLVALALTPQWAHAGPHTDAASTVSLEQIMAWANDHAPLQLAAEAERYRGDAQLDAASPWLPENPELAVGAGQRRHGADKSIDFELSLEQTVEIAGERGLRRAAAGRLQALSHLRSAAIRWEIQQRVHAAFQRALVARERAAATTRVLAYAQRLLEIAKKRLNAGDVSPLQLRVAQGEVARARQAAVAAENAYGSSRLALAEHSGWPADDPPVPIGRLGAPRRAPELTSLLTIAQIHNPTLQVREGAVHAATASKRLADREAWPKPTLGVAYARESTPDGAAPEHMGMLMLGVPLPLWQRNHAQRAEAGAALRAARADRALITQALHARVARTRATVNAAADRIAVYGDEILPAFEENLRLLERAFALGEISLLQVMVAQERFLAIEQDALTAYDDYFTAVADLEAMIGQDVWPDSPATPHTTTEEHL